MQERVSLRELTTMKVGGDARFFISVRTEGEVKEAVRIAKENELPIFVLGGGSNVIISDEGFSGLVIKIEIPGVNFSSENNYELVRVGAGENWDELVQLTVERNLHGLENLSLIPGTVGAAPVQNIGAYGVEIKDTLVSVKVFDIENEEFKEFKNEDCQFSYRDSIFKQQKNFIITEVVFRLSKEQNFNLSYRDLRKEIEEDFDSSSVSLKDIRKAVIKIRQRKLPDPKLIPTAGSFFKNPIISLKKFEELKKDHPDMPGYTVGDKHIKVPLAWVIENVVKMKGFKYGGAGVYEEHALVLVNQKERASARDVYELSTEIKRAIFRHTDIAIEPEVQFIGKF